jgi:CheY-like chemotaxis protein
VHAARLRRHAKTGHYDQQQPLDEAGFNPHADSLIVLTLPLMSQSANTPHLLLVEDDPVSRAFLAEALRLLPAEVTAVECIADAESLASTTRHALWLIDAHLPDGDGVQCLRRLRALQPDVPALSVTAEAFAEELTALLAAGFMEVIQKPVTIALLLASVRRSLGQPAIAVIAEPGPKLPEWDDAAALAALGGNVASLTMLRGLFFAELPGDREHAFNAFQHGDADSVRAVLHRLKASCGFVGAIRLRQAVQAWSEAPLDADSRQRFEWATNDLLATQD